MATIANRKVERANFHVGAFSVPRTGCDSVKDKAYMELTPAGLYIDKPDGEWLVPYSNVTWCKLVAEKKDGK